ncbi:MAG TPA: lipoprotein insertase outer membrane protein LolB [Candidatus Berkiella sp.]|nr:lipoprotein insertase outer membrane protein LolB [Candidatus Berkiella sp.]
MNRFNVLALLLLLLAGCASNPEKNSQAVPPSPALEKQWKSNEKQLDAINQWQAEGRLAVTQGNKGGNASFVWQQQGDFYQIKIFGPFGAKSAYIIGSPHHVELKEANGKVSTARTPEALLNKVAGWHVPLSGLRYWMRGTPVSQVKVNSKQFNDKGLLASLEQQGWHVEYQEYHRSAFAPLPSKILLTNGQVKVKMIINDWKQL